MSIVRENVSSSHVRNCFLFAVQSRIDRMYVVTFFHTHTAGEKKNKKNIQRSIYDMLSMQYARVYEK